MMQRWRLQNGNGDRNREQKSEETEGDDTYLSRHFQIGQEGG